MLTVVFTWADERGGVHSTAAEEFFRQFRERFKRFPDRVVVTLDGPGWAREVVDYQRPNGSGLRAKALLPRCVAALEEAEAALSRRADSTPDRMVLALVRAALAEVRAGDALTPGGP